MTNIDAVDLIDVAGMSVEVVRKGIKNLHVGVYPPEGHVRVAAPPAVSLDAIRLAVLTRIAWIRRKQTEFRRQPRETRRQSYRVKPTTCLGAHAASRCGMTLLDRTLLWLQETAF
jgi:predicted metal-dependent hydrolase